MSIETAFAGLLASNLVLGYYLHVRTLNQLSRLSFDIKSASLIAALDAHFQDHLTDCDLNRPAPADEQEAA